MTKIIEDRIEILEYENSIEKNETQYQQRLLILLDLKLVLKQYNDKKNKRRYNQVSKLYQA